jgi:gas vesicle protein
MRDSGFTSFLAGVAVGGLVGAAVGLLLAPAPGERLREQVGEFVDDRRAAFDEAVNEGRAVAELARAEMLAAEDEHETGEPGGDVPDAGDAPGTPAEAPAT